MKKRRPRQYAKALYAITANLSEKMAFKTVDAFFAILTRDRMLQKAPQILKEYLLCKERAEGKTPIEVMTKSKLDSKMKKIIQEKFGKNRSLIEKIDETISGGVILRDGDTAYQATIDAQLKKLIQHLSVS